MTEVKLMAGQTIESMTPDQREQLQQAIERLNQIYKIGTSEEPPLGHSPIIGDADALHTD